MENLIIRTSNRKLAGLVWIVGGIGLLIIGITGKEPLDTSDWIRSIGFCVIGLIFFTPLVGSDIAKVEIYDGYLKVKWVNWYRTVTVMESEIESIILAKNGVMIKRKDMKPLMIKFHLIEKSQREYVYRFFTDYAHLKDFVREKKLGQI